MKLPFTKSVEVDGAVKVPPDKLKGPAQVIGAVPPLKVPAEMSMDFAVFIQLAPCTMVILLVCRFILSMFTVFVKVTVPEPECPSNMAVSAVPGRFPAPGVPLEEVAQ